MTILFIYLKKKEILTCKVLNLLMCDITLDTI